MVLNPCGYVSSDWAQVLYNEFGRFGFTGSRLSRNNKTLVLHVILEWFVGWFGQCKYMWRKTSQFLAMISKDVVLNKDNNLNRFILNDFLNPRYCTLRMTRDMNLVGHDRLYLRYHILEALCRDWLQPRLFRYRSEKKDVKVNI